jgi:cell fate (sporulation/competence/biofilm development) regulator YlbF (YheA/YmcA/DUF963 family)
MSNTIDNTIGNTIDKLREFCTELQKDERYVNFHNASDTFDKDENLQQKIGEFNLKKLNLNAEIAKPDRDADKISLLDTEINRLYDEITGDKAFTAYNSAKAELDGLMSEINSIIMQSANGADPLTCQPQSACGGSCSTCGGCN